MTILCSWLSVTRTQPARSLPACLPDGCREVTQDGTKTKGCSFQNKTACFSNQDQPQCYVPKAHHSGFMFINCPCSKSLCYCHVLSGKQAPALPRLSWLCQSLSASSSQIWSPESVFGNLKVTGITAGLDKEIHRISSELSSC